jgi:hypothetical protein
LRFERTFDFELVRRILTHPQLYPRMGDDYIPPVEQYQVPTDPRFWYLLAFDGDELLGLVPLYLENVVCWQLHFALLPHTWGGKSHDVGRELPGWLWANTPCRRLVAHVPAWNERVLRFLPKYMGMTQYGRNTKAFMTGGILHDLIDMGVSKPA